MKQAKLIFMVLVVMLFCCSYSIGQSSSGIGGASPLIGNNGVSSVYLVGVQDFVCNLISSCGMYDPARVSDGAIVNLGGVKRVFLSSPYFVPVDPIVLSGATKTTAQYL